MTGLEVVLRIKKRVATESKLTGYLDRAAKLDAEFLVYDDGYRGRTYRYAQVAGMANALRERLRASNLRKGDAAMIWSESRPGWVAALWACLLEGVVVVPVDPQSSAGSLSAHRAESRRRA